MRNLERYLHTNPERVLQLLNAMIDGMNRELDKHDDRKICDIFMAAHNLHMHIVSEVIDDIVNQPDCPPGLGMGPYLWRLAMETFTRDCERAIAGKDWRKEPYEPE